MNLHSGRTTANPIEQSMLFYLQLIDCKSNNYYAKYKCPRTSTQNAIVSFTIFIVSSWFIFSPACYLAQHIGSLCIQTKSQALLLYSQFNLVKYTERIIKRLHTPFFSLST